MRRKKLTPLVAMSIWARQHGVSYGQAQTLMSAGKLTYEQLGCTAPKSAYTQEPKYELKTCIMCGVQFEPNMPYQKYCGEKCRRKADNNRAAYYRRRTKD